MMANKAFIFSFADVEVREREFRLSKAGEVLPVEPKAFRVLLFLLRNPGKLIEKEELLTAVWGDAAVTDNSLARSIALLRKLLGDDPRVPRFIETVSTVGYRFIAQVEVREDSAGILSGVQSASAVEEVSGAAPSQKAPSPPTPRQTPSRPLWVKLAAVCVVAVLAAGIWYLRRPLPLPQITDSVRITNDSKIKNIMAQPATDGLHLYLIEGLPGTTGSGIAQLSASGGETTYIDTALHQVGGVDAISPDLSELLVNDHDANLWTQPLPGGTARRVGNIHAGAVCFTPDGAHIVYADENSINIANRDGSGSRR